MNSPRDSSQKSWRLAAVLLAAAWWIFDLGVLRAGVPSRIDDTWEYGLVARSLLDGHGFRTAMIHPPLWGYRDAALTVPMAIHGPMLSLLLVAPLALFGSGILDHIAWLGALGAVLAVFPLVRLGERCGESALGFGAAALWTLSPLTLRAVHHDAGLTLGAALALAALELATRPEPRAFAAGVAMGLAALVRPELAIGALLLAAVMGRRGLPVLGGAALCLVPLGLHHALVFGHPFFNLSSLLMLGYWRGHWGDSPLRDFSLTPQQFPSALAAASSTLPAKWIDFLPHAIKRALLAPTPATGWLALLGVTLAIASRKTRASALRLAPFAGIPIAVMTVFTYDPRYLTPLLPLWALAAARGMRELARRMPRWAQRPRAWLGMLALLIAPSVAPVVRGEAGEERVLADALSRERARIREWTQHADSTAVAGELRPAFSDIPDFLAWTSGHPVVWVTPTEYERLPERDDGSGRPVRGGPGDTYFHPDEPELGR